MLRVSDLFPREAGRAKGYDPSEVDEYLEKAREQYTEADPELTAESIRRVSFALRRGGYRMHAVDRALERLEDAVAKRERETIVSKYGENALTGAVTELTDEIVERLERPRGEKFRRVSILRKGYRTDDVDRFASQLVNHLRHGAELSANEVRRAAFLPARGGYNEDQVDVLLDAVVDVISASA